MTNKPFIVRRVVFWHEEHQKAYVYITNNFEQKPETIAEIYRRRWQIEVLFRRLKQNFPLKHFLGDNQNTIEIQIWVSLIIQLIMLVINKHADKWSFTNMVSIIRFHLMYYIDLMKFLKNPEGKWDNLKTKDTNQLMLFQ